jgi:hypothetical protein
MGNCGWCSHLQLAGATYANTPPDTLDGQTFVVRPIKVNDGDTLWVAALSARRCCGLPARQRLHIRVKGYDSPELHPKTLKTSHAYALEMQAAHKAKDFLETMLRGHLITARFGKRDKYGRHLAELFVSGKNITAIMIAAGHGVPYAGGAKAIFEPQAAAERF